MVIKLFLIALIVGALALARKARPAGDRQGQGLNDAWRIDAHQEKDTLTVATFNIQTGKSLQGVRDIQRSADAIQQADLVGVQEVYAPTLLNRLKSSNKQPQALASQGQFAWLYSPTRIRWFTEHRGNLLLSKLPISDWQITMLPDQSGESYRNMTVAKVHWQGRHFYFINTHLHTREGREEQLDVVLQEFAKYPRAILVGDFNSNADTPHLANALRDIEINDAISTAGLTELFQQAEEKGEKSNTKGPIDWILTKGFTVHGGHFIEKGISDHPYYEVSLSYCDDETF